MSRAAAKRTEVFRRRRGRLSAGRLFSRGLGADQRGAAVVEFALAILPILITFFGMFQWGVLAYVHLIVKHGAFVAARAEAVVHPQMPDSGPEDDVKAGVMALFKHVTLVQPSDVSIVADVPGPMDQMMDRVTVNVDYPCGVPLGNVIACGKSKRYKFSETAAFPNQGSYYQRVWAADL
jgi:hypothetical protein